MAVTTTAFNSLLATLKSNHPALVFSPGTEYRWSFRDQTVWYDPDSKDAVALLHETAHGLLGHDSYDQDVQLIHFERDAWEKARELGLIYGVSVESDYVEDALDTYRDWLHARSICPSCQQSGFQTAGNRYSCPLCSQEWNVNDSRHCGLRRRRIASTK